VNKDLEITKSIMTHIHLILGNEPGKNHTFNSIQELYDKIDARLEPDDTTKEASYHRKELLCTFDQNIEWMKVRKIIISDHNKNGDTLGIKIDKEKLVKYIVDPEMPLIETNNDIDNDR
jgi:arginyl-tRNA synthetase